MKKSLLKLTCFAFVAAALLATPAVSHAQNSTNAAAATAAAPKKRSLPFHGKVTAVDATAMTFTISTLNIAITSKTKITKDGTPAVFADITVGENISGSYKKDDAGKMTANTIHIGEVKKKTNPAAATNAAPSAATSPK